MSFKEYLSYIREYKKVSKTELARKIDLSPSFIMNIESGIKKAPALTRVRQIAKALELNKDETNNLIQLAAADRTGQEELLILQSHTTPILNKNTRILQKGDNDTTECPHCNKKIFVGMVGDNIIIGKVI